MTKANWTAIQRALGDVTVDGIQGAKTYASLHRAASEGRVTVAPRVAAPVGAKTDGLVDALRAASGGAVVASGGLKRIIMHWSAGSHVVSDLDREHYNFIVDGEGNVYPGRFSPEANIDTRDGAYAAHTLNCNTGSIGVAMAAMRGAVERPFLPGDQPITKVQLEAFTRMVADLARKYGIPVTRFTVLTHAEVQPTLGIAQRGKWDICWLPGMDNPGGAVEVGEALRAMINSH